VKKIFFSLVISLLFLSLPKTLYSQSEFLSDVTVDYVVSDHGTTTVTYDVILTNNVSDLYATNYTLTITGANPINPKAMQDSKPLSLDVEANKDATNLKVNFTDSVVGKGNQRHFSLTFEDNTIATKTGEVWEVVIPKIASLENFESYTVNVNIPQSFGELAYMSPETNLINTNDGRKIYTFGKNLISKSGVVAAFGQFQVFEFNLDYHLENPLAKIALAEIAIPPDTSYQRVSYSELTPRPETVTIDKDGNWIALYKLAPHERSDVKAVGNVQIFSGPRYKTTLSDDQKVQYLAATDYWQTQSPIVKEVAANLKTPYDIYNYVVSNLKYNYDRVKPNVTRLGAEEALKHPTDAICMEFTDTFIALARAVGIPAREINGYAYTENSELQPLSLVADVLHSWPEYYDNDKQVWVPVDPTWGNTTGGVDFFSKLDLRHFTFVTHGVDSVKPYPPGSYKLGSTPQKDIYVNFGKLKETIFSTPQITIKNKESLSLFNSVYSVTIDNPGPTSIDKKDIEVYFDDKKQETHNVSILPPYANTSIDINVPIGFLGHNTPSKVEVFYGTQSASLPTQKSTVIIGSLVLVLVLIFAAILYLFTKTILKKDSKLYEKLTHSRFTKKLFGK
jgi:transglutaminase-like putative cysteine protease